MNSFAQRLLLAACMSVPFACGDDSGSDEPQLDASVNTKSDAGDDHLDDEVPCDATYPGFTSGMSVKAGALTVKLMSITPNPPRQKVKNSWTLQVVDAAGAPVSGITFANGASYMPVHNHYGNTPPVSAPGSTADTVQLNNIDFIMRGPWQVIFDVQQNGTSAGRATFQICVE